MRTEDLRAGRARHGEPGEGGGESDDRQRGARVADGAVLPGDGPLDVHDDKRGSAAGRSRRSGQGVFYGHVRRLCRDRPAYVGVRRVEHRGGHPQPVFPQPHFRPGRAVQQRRVAIHLLLHPDLDRSDDLRPDRLFPAGRGPHVPRVAEGMPAERFKHGWEPRQDNARYDEEPEEELPPPPPERPRGGDHIQRGPDDGFRRPSP